MKTFAYVRNLDEGTPWVAEYPTRKDLEISEQDLSGSYRVIYQHSSEPEDEDYPALAEGEVLLWHSIYGLVIIQSIDLNYYESLLDNGLVSQ
jgi:hypothetical protein